MQVKGRAGGCAEPLRAAAGAGPRAAGGVSRSRSRDGERRDCDAQAGRRAPGWTWTQAPGPTLGGLVAAVAAVGERCCPPPAAESARRCSRRRVAGAVISIAALSRLT